MRGPNNRDDRRVGFKNTAQIGDFAGMTRANLDHARFRRFRDRQQRQGETDIVVQVADCRMHKTAAGINRRRQLFGCGLASASGDAKDKCLQGAAAPRRGHAQRAARFCYPQQRH